ncbi:MAG TPA: biotin/lipoyl-containing protein [Patescibacteria group bacterium]|nr:biotin/lipoyl-containing protein [Patescibacteria group bacterium]
MREYVMSVGGKEFHAGIKELNAEYALVQVDDTEYKVILKQLGSGQSVFSGLARSVVQPPTHASAAATVRESAQVMAQPTQSAAAAPEGSGTIPAPLPGLVLDLLVREGDVVKAGQSLLIMEAMKMENQIQAPFDGTVKKIFVQKGANISEGDKLIEISRPFMTTL